MSCRSTKIIPMISSSHCLGSVVSRSSGGRKPITLELSLVGLRCAGVAREASTSCWRVCILCWSP